MREVELINGMYDGLAVEIADDERYLTRRGREGAYLGGIQTAVYCYEVSGNYAEYCYVAYLVADRDEGID